MKNLILVLFAAFSGTVVFAQEKKVVNEEVIQEKVKSENIESVEIRREVKMIEENGTKVLTIITYNNGVPSEEIFNGAAAEKKMAELKKEEAKEYEKRAAIKKEEIDRKK